jgi:hypothetical protein
MSHPPLLSHRPPLYYPTAPCAVCRHEERREKIRHRFDFGCRGGPGIPAALFRTIERCLFARDNTLKPSVGLPCSGCKHVADLACRFGDERIRN